MLIKRISKKGLSLILTLCVFASLFPVGAVATAAEAEAGAAVAAEVEYEAVSSTDPTVPKYDPNTAEVGHYSGENLDRSILVRHTGKTSEILEETNDMIQLADPNNYTDEEYFENFITTSADEGLYDGLGFEYNKLRKNAKNYAADPDCQNPLSGYSYKPERAVHRRVQPHLRF